MVLKFGSQLLPLLMAAILEPNGRCDVVLVSPSRVQITFADAKFPVPRSRWRNRISADSGRKDEVAAISSKFGNGWRSRNDLWTPRARFTIALSGAFWSAKAVCVRTDARIAPAGSGKSRIPDFHFENGVTLPAWLRKTPQDP